MKQSELFEKIKELLSRPGAWIQDDMCRDIYGIRCSHESWTACEFSLLGATLFVQHRFQTVIVWHESNLELCRWNDVQGRTIDEVLAKVELEIKIARIREEFACAA